MILNRPDSQSISKLGIKIFEILVIKFPYLKGNSVVSASLKLVLILNADMTLERDRLKGTDNTDNPPTTPTLHFWTRWGHIIWHRHTPTSPNSTPSCCRWVVGTF